MPEERPVAQDDDPPPLGRSWGTLYGVVLGTLAVLIALFYAFTWVFR